MLTHVFKSIFSALPEELDHQTYRQHFLLNFVLPFGALIMYFFTFYNYFVLERPFISLIAFLSAIAFSIAFFQYRYKQKPRVPILISIIALVLFILTFNYTNQNQGFGLVWTVVFPIIIFISLGIRWGIIIALGLWLINLPILIQGLGIWLEGTWDVTGLIRFSVAYLLVSLIMLMTEYAGAKAHNRLYQLTQKQSSLMDQLRILTYSDPLTGIHNRRKLAEDLALTPAKMRFEKKCLVFCILDIDDFKTYNDNYGHHRGDETLLSVAHTVRDHLVPLHGEIYRIGGEEFAISFLAESDDMATQVVQALVNRVANKSIKHQYCKQGVITVSIGFVITNQTDFIFEKLYKSADIALYQAKSNGKNQSIQGRL